MNILQICPLHLSDVATLPWKIQKVIFHDYYSYTSDYVYTFAQKKTSSNCCTAALAVYLLLFSAFYYLIYKTLVLRLAEIVKKETAAEHTAQYSGSANSLVG